MKEKLKRKTEKLGTQPPQFVVLWNNADCLKSVECMSLLQGLTLVPFPPARAASFPILSVDPCSGALMQPAELDLTFTLSYCNPGIFPSLGRAGRGMMCVIFIPSVYSHRGCSLSSQSLYTEQRTPFLCHVKYLTSNWSLFMQKSNRCSQWSEIFAPAI